APTAPAALAPPAELRIPESGTLPASEIVGKGEPGAETLEGTQVSTLTIQKIVPPEIQIGTASTWQIVVQNRSDREAQGVQIRDEIPKGTKLAGTHPPAQVSSDGTVVWEVGSMPPKTQATVKMELIPTEEGTIGSVASVICRSDASARTLVTRPMLEIETLGDSAVLLGEQVELTIVVSNPGTGVTRNVTLSEKVPTELQFEGGAELLYKVGDLQPGERKMTKLPLTAVRKGTFENCVLAEAEGDLSARSVFAMEVTAPALEAKLVGPSKRFLDKEGTFKLELTNAGTAPAKNIEMKVALPRGWKFVNAEYGRYDATTHSILWGLEELGAKEPAEAEFVLSPSEIGAFSLKYTASADICIPISGEKNVSVEGIAALMFQVADSNDPIQVGEETTYTVSVVNQGSKQAENVQTTVSIPAGLELVSCKEATRSSQTATGREIAFNAIPTLAPKAQKTYQFVLRGVTSGDQRVVVRLSSREFQTPIVKEESTRVFSE
ncbi:MAG: NEW3 domain-containing protein, partial [Planctomycetia bacterium]|nr:NEW3 domain-containing protein [Planctomycetia bacterium]